MTTSSAQAGLAARMAEAAVAFADVLDGGQRDLALWPFPADDERRRWFYTPTDHGGLPLAAMGPAQQRAALRLVASGLSQAAYVTVATIIGLENVLDATEGWRATLGRERGRDPGLYYLRVFGDPGGPSWAWRFGGHHVSINHLVVDGEARSCTPCFLGADPARAPLLGPHPLRPLAGAEDLGRELVRSLDEEQLAAALLSPIAPIDIVTANRPQAGDGDLPLPLPDIWRVRFDGALGDQLQAVHERSERSAGVTPEHLEAVRLTATPKGVPAASLRVEQRELLRALLDVYVRRVPDDLADAEAAKYDGARLDALGFAWAGGTEVGEPHYYRVQGPGLLVELDNTQRGANHVHTVWRDPDGDFGGDVLGLHLREDHPPRFS